MKFYTIGKSATGIKHKQSNSHRQDSFRLPKPNAKDRSIVIAAVADGHGSPNCRYSCIGSKKAVNAFFDVFEDLTSQLDYDYERLQKYITDTKDDFIPKKICNLWKDKVEEFHRKSHPDEPFEPIYYGTTLIGIIVCPLFCFSFQIGDGDILIVDSTGLTVRMMDSEKILGNETYSLSSKDAWKFSNTMMKHFQSNDDIPALFLISTDGMSNSFVSETDFLKCGKDYFFLLKEHGVEVVKNNLEIWLNETMENGCGDDITLVLIINEDIILNSLPKPKG